MTRTPRPYTDLPTLMALESPARRQPSPLKAQSLSRQSGFHVARRPGSGMTFAEHRTYRHGDPLRDLDWKVTARRGQPHVRTWEAEHAHSLYLAVDLTPALFFGSRWSTRSATAADCAAFLAWQAFHNQDPVSLTVLTSPPPPVARPLRHRRALIAALHQLADQQRQLAPGQPAGESPWTEWLTSLQSLSRLKGSLVIITSPFQLHARTLDVLQTLQKRLTPVILLMTDPLDTLARGPLVTATDGRQQGQVHLGGLDVLNRVKSDLLARRLPHLCIDTALPVAGQFAALSQGVPHAVAT